MAVAAELAPPPFSYQLVDTIPEVAVVRAETRLAARAVLEQRRHIRAAGGAEAQALPQQIDALSTADAVLQALTDFGPDSAEALEREAGLLLDCGRLVGEWFRKKKAEYFEPVRHYYDERSEQFFSHGLSINQMTWNALVPVRDNQEEEDRRINEHVEDATPQVVRRSLGQLAIGRQTIRTVSQCTDKAITDYWSDKKAGRPHTGYDGYVPEIEKVMIRDIKLDTDSNDRFEEQVGLSGLFLTHEVIKIALERRGAAVSGMSKTDVHGAQFLASDDLMEFVAYLDSVASEQWCREIFMGEEVAKDTVKDYEAFRHEALQRKKYLEDMSQTVANYVLDLASDPSVERRTAPAKVEEFVKALLLDISKQDRVVAEQMFDIDTANELQQVAWLESQGRHAEAFVLQQEILKKAPGGGSCGGAACGLEEIDPQSLEGKRLAKKLKAAAGDKISKDRKRKCQKCGGRNVAYAYNMSKVNKGCGDCGAFESKASQASEAA